MLLFKVEKLIFLFSCIGIIYNYMMSRNVFGMSSTPWHPMDNSVLVVRLSFQSEITHYYYYLTLAWVWHVSLFYSHPTTWNTRTIYPRTTSVRLKHSSTSFPCIGRFSNLFLILNRIFTYWYFSLLRNNIGMVVLRGNSVVMIEAKDRI